MESGPKALEYESFEGKGLGQATGVGLACKGRRVENSTATGLSLGCRFQHSLKGPVFGRFGV